MDLIIPLSQFHIIVCKKCQIGVLPNSQWDSHFRKHKISRQLRQTMKERALADPAAIQNEIELRDRFQYPVHQSAIEELPIYTDGLACEMHYDDGNYDFDQNLIRAISYHGLSTMDHGLRGSPRAKA